MLLSWGKLFNRFVLAPYLFQTSVLHSIPSVARLILLGRGG